MHWILSPEPEQAADQASCTSIPLVEELLACPEYEQEKEQETWLRRQLSVTPQQARDIADQTTGQRDNPLWSVIRKTRFTASNFGDILRAVKLNRSVKIVTKYSISFVNFVHSVEIISF